MDPRITSEHTHRVLLLVTATLGPSHRPSPPQPPSPASPKVATLEEETSPPTKMKKGVRRKGKARRREPMKTVSVRKIIPCENGPYVTPLNTSDDSDTESVLLVEH